VVSYCASPRTLTCSITRLCSSSHLASPGLASSSGFFSSALAPVFFPSVDPGAKTGDCRSVGPYRLSIPGQRMSSFVMKHLSKSLGFVSR
jgi:hypothetical protein